MIDLLPRHLELVKKILEAHLPRVEVKVFGSRATGKAQPYSDLDLVDWNRVSPSFRKVIQETWAPLP